MVSAALEAYGYKSDPEVSSITDREHIAWLYVIHHETSAHLACLCPSAGGEGLHQGPQDAQPGRRARQHR